VFSCVLSDLFWFRIGRKGNYRVVQFLCRISLEPDTCVQRTSSLVEKHGAKSLLVTKFIPGLNAMAAPLAGSGGIRLPIFLLFDLLGSILWCGSFLLVGYIFRERVADIAAEFGKFKAVIAVSLLVAIPAGYIVFKSWQRRKFIREIWMERITPDELLQRIEARENLAIIDLRHALDFLPDPRILPDAIRIRPDELEERYEEIPRDREIILYCT
jgi:hypothetical protein